MNNAVVSDPSLPAPTKGVEGAAISVLMEEDKVNNAAVSDPSLPGPTKEDEGALPEATPISDCSTLESGLGSWVPATPKKPPPKKKRRSRVAYKFTLLRSRIASSGVAGAAKQRRERLSHKSRLKTKKNSKKRNLRGVPTHPTDDRLEQRAFSVSESDLLSNMVPRAW